MELNSRYDSIRKKLANRSSLRAMLREEQSLENAISGSIPFDPRYNAVPWAFDCLTLAREIVYSYCWMEAHAASQEVRNRGNLFYVSYFADNCMMRIDSFKDKAALLVWAYYCPFNPERRDEVLQFEDIVSRLRCPIRFGLTIRNQQAFLKELEKLQGRYFKRAERYRHLKIHRREPKIILQPRTQSDGLPYMFPLISDKDIKSWHKKLRKQYRDQKVRSRVERSCYIQGTLFDKRETKDEYWCFREVRKLTRECVCSVIDVAKGLSTILRRRKPLRGNR